MKKIGRNSICGAQSSEVTRELLGGHPKDERLGVAL